MGDVYVEDLEKENEKLREQLASVQLELDTLKNPPKSAGWRITATAATVPIVGSVSNIGFMHAGSMLDINNFVSNVSLCGVTVSQEDIAAMVERRKFMDDFTKASIWKRITMLWTLLVTKKNLKKE